MNASKNTLSIGIAHPVVIDRDFRVIIGENHTRSVRQHEIVGIEEHNKIAARLRKTGVEAGSVTSINRLEDTCDSRSVP